MFLEVQSCETLQSVLDRMTQFLTERKIPEERIFDGKLVVCELVSNVFKHGSGGAASVSISVENGFIEMKIRSDDTYCPPKNSACADVFSENGRGLFLIDNVCAERKYLPDGSIVVLIKIEK